MTQCPPMGKNDARHIPSRPPIPRKNRSHQSPPERGKYDQQEDDKGAAFILHTMRLGLNKLKSDGNAIADEETTTPPPPGRPALPRRAPRADPFLSRRRKNFLTSAIGNESKRGLLFDGSNPLLGIAALIEE